MSKNVQLALVMSGMNKSAFDFIGEFGGIANECVHLKNALTIRYTDNLVADGVTALYVPLGLLNVKDNPTEVDIPMSSVAYIVYFSGDSPDTLCGMYWDFFSQTTGREG